MLLALSKHSLRAVHIIALALSGITRSALGQDDSINRIERKAMGRCVPGDLKGSGFAIGSHDGRSDHGIRERELQAQGVLDFPF